MRLRSEYRSEAPVGCFHCGFSYSHPLRRKVTRKLDDEDRILRRQRNHQDQSYLRIEVHRKLSDDQSNKDTYKSSRYYQDNCNRIGPALVLRREDQINQRDRQRKDEIGPFGRRRPKIRWTSAAPSRPRSSSCASTSGW